MARWTPFSSSLPWCAMPPVSGPACAIFTVTVSSLGASTCLAASRPHALSAIAAARNHTGCRFMVSAFNHVRYHVAMTQALIIVDIQNDYFPGGKMELVGSEAAAVEAGRLLRAFRERGAPIF